MPNEKAMKREPMWDEIAETDPAIQAWFQQLARRFPIPEGASVSDFMLRDRTYDYRSAIQAGARPTLQEDGTFHWPSGNREQIWKSLDHPTVMMEIEERLKKGVPIPPSHASLVDAREKAHSMTEGLIPYLTQRDTEDLPVGREMSAIGRFAGRGLEKIYPSLRRPPAR